jgi:hypothetical protein
MMRFLLAAPPAIGGQDSEVENQYDLARGSSKPRMVPTTASATLTPRGDARVVVEGASDQHEPRFRRSARFRRLPEIGPAKVRTNDAIVGGLLGLVDSRDAQIVQRDARQSGGGGAFRDAERTLQ